MNKGRRSRLSRITGKSIGRARENDPPDLFGLQREYRISESKVRQVFTPHQPVSTQNLLFGRQQEVHMLIQTLNTPGQHVLLYGERGVGKSSLANVATLVVQAAMGKRVFTKRCDTTDTFETVLKAPLAAVGADLTLIEVIESSSNSNKSGLNAAGLSLAREKAREIVATYKALGEVSPSSVAEAIKDIHGLLVVDEADAISDPNDRQKLAELIKHLSDNSSAFKLVIVGIAETGNELTAAHPSVQRCLRETKLQRMADHELVEIVTTGARALELELGPGVTESIVKLSDGYPHFTHLIALKCAEEAISIERNHIDKEHLAEALNLAVRDAEGTLRRIYEDSVRSSSQMFKTIIVAAASIGSDEFSAAQLRHAISIITGSEIPQNALNNYYQKLISSDGKTIIRRTAHGYYRFEDPRMASFVRIVNQMF